MEFKQKTIGVLSSGGDAPGMNAAIRSVVRTALNRNIRVLGIRRGYSGLLARDMFEMNLRSVSDTLHRGGTILYTARCSEFRTAEVSNAAKRSASRWELTAWLSLAATARSAARGIYL